MRTRISRAAAAVLAVGLFGGVLAGCGDDDDTITSSGGGGNSITIEMKDYAYAIKGELTAGLATIASENTGDEFHMMVMARLKDGVKFEDVRKALQEEFSGGGGDGGEEGGDATTTTEAALASPDLQLIAQTSSSTSTTAVAGGAGQEEEEEGGEGEDPFAKFFEEDESTDAFGHVLQPGAAQSITADVLTAGTYGIICFIPTAEEGVPHIAKGMIGSIEVKAGTSKAKAPKADATYTLTDGEAPTGPDALKAGENVIELKSDGTDSDNELIGVRPDDGEDFTSMDEWFTELFESEEPPAKGYADSAPGELLLSAFVVPKGKSVWIAVNLEKGDYEFVNGTGGDEDDTDYQALKVKVS